MSVVIYLTGIMDRNGSKTSSCAEIKPSHTQSSAVCTAFNTIIHAKNRSK